MAMRELEEQLNILVIEDDDAARGMLTELLSRAEDFVLPVASAEEGLELLPQWTFQVAFLDHNLPGMDGSLLGEYLRRSNPEMSIVLLTASDDPSLVKRTQAAGIEFLPKPFRRSEISRILEETRARLRSVASLRRAQQDTDFAPPLRTFADQLPQCFDLPQSSARVKDALVQVLKRCMNDLRSEARYSERDRVVALAGLVTARVLNIDLPRASSGKTLYEEYDSIMQSHGRRTEFS